MEKTIDKLSKIINNEKVDDVFYNLFDRWLDESQYEDINEYGKTIINVIDSQFPKYKVRLVSSTPDPFGIIMEIDHIQFNIYIQLKGDYAVLKVSKVNK